MYGKFGMKYVSESSIIRLIFDLSILLNIMAWIILLREQLSALHKAEDVDDMRSADHGKGEPVIAGGSGWMQAVRPG